MTKPGVWSWPAAWRGWRRTWRCPLVKSRAAPVLLARTLNVALDNAGFPMPVRMWDDETALATVH